MTTASILTSRNLDERNRAAAGGKGDNLYRLTREGFPVPPWFIVPIEAFAAFLDQHNLRERLRAMLQDIDFQQQASVRETSDRIKTIIERKDIPVAWQEEIRRYYHGDVLDRNGQDAFVAVRSSAVGEDSATQSFAGQLDTFLFVKGEAQVLQAIKGCWASAFSARGLSYRHLNQLSLADIQVAVVVQQMVFGEISGVTFTANPTNGNRDQVVVSATYGLGEGLVSGRLSADTFVLDVGTQKIVEELADKPRMLMLDRARGWGTAETDVPPELQQKSCLSREQVLAVAEAGSRIQALYGVPQDIEWTLADGTLHILQTRPITNLAAAPAPRGRMTIWDNSNITESYSGVTSPLTFSFARQAYSIVYHQFCEVMGIAPEIIKDHNRTYRNMLGLLRGRIYYNLQNWYRLLSLFPGFNYNKAYMEQMMGLKDIMPYDKDAAPASFHERYFVELPKLLGLVRRMSHNFRHIDAIVDGFQDNFNRAYGLYKDRDLRAMPPDEIVAAYYDLERRLLWNWKAPIITDFFAMIFYGVLKKLVTGWVGDESGSLQNNLLCGQGNIESTEPTKAIMRMAAMARADARISEFLLATADKDIWPALQAREDLAPFRAQIQDYLKRYGYRCMNELKLEEKNLKEDPSFIFTMIKNYLKLKQLDVAAMEEQERGIRIQAEGVVDHKLRGPLRRRLFAWVLDNARKHVRNRENMRFARTKIFGLLREMFQALGHHFHGMGVLDKPEDVFYLNLEELLGFVEGTATCEKLDELARLRRREFDRYRREPADDRIITYGAVYYRNAFTSDAGSGGGEDGTLRGISCCPGTVEGPVKAILSSNDDMNLNGEILVCERTDPGWVPLYPSASGLLIERGSILSHSAIVARELGLPTIVGIKNLTKHVKTGMTIKMDAREGIVYLPVAD